MPKRKRVKERQTKESEECKENLKFQRIETICSVVTAILLIISAPISFYYAHKSYEISQETLEKTFYSGANISVFIELTKVVAVFRGEIPPIVDYALIIYCKATNSGDKVGTIIDGNIELETETLKRRGETGIARLVDIMKGEVLSDVEVPPGGAVRFQILAWLSAGPAFRFYQHNETVQIEFNYTYFDGLRLTHSVTEKREITLQFEILRGEGIKYASYLGNQVLNVTVFYPVRVFFNTEELVHERYKRPEIELKITKIEGKGYSNYSILNVGEDVTIHYVMAYLTNSSGMLIYGENIALSCYQTLAHGEELPINLSSLQNYLLNLGEGTYWVYLAVVYWNSEGQLRAAEFPIKWDLG